MAITDLIGFMAACSSAQGRGITAAGTDAAATVDAAATAGASATVDVAVTADAAHMQDGLPMAADTAVAPE
jgi:guanyl-specific ribonuclease Sa